MVSSFSDKQRLVPSLAMCSAIALVCWLGDFNGGYFTSGWAPVALIYALGTFALSAAGISKVMWSRWSALAMGLFTAYSAWTLFSMLWSPNQGSAWTGAGLTLLYLLAFWLTLSLIGLGASRRWIFAASVVGPAMIAAYTLSSLATRTSAMFENDRLLGTVGYYNGEAAFLFVSFWPALYLAGSRRIHPLLRGLALAGSTLCVSVAVLTQSRGAMVAAAISLVVFFVLSGQRVRGFLALLPVAAALLTTFPGLNEVYRTFQEGGDPSAAISRAVPTVWLAAAGAGIYGLLWGMADGRVKPPARLVRAFGGVLLACCIVGLSLGAITFHDHVGNPVTWGEQKWEAFKTNDITGDAQTRYLSASGRGRYTLWQVAWRDFVTHPVLGVGTQNYQATYYRYRQDTAGYVQQPHALPLEVLAERGAVGGALFFGFLTVCVGTGLWERFRRLNAEGKVQVGAATAAVCYWFVHSSVEWFWQLPAVTLPAMVYLAVLAAPWDGVGEPVPRRGRTVRIAGAAVSAVIVATIVPLYVADHYLHKSETATNPHLALAYVERAQKFDPVEPRLSERKAELALKLGDWTLAEQAYREAARLDPDDYAPYALLGLLLEKRGEKAQALSFYDKALSLNPLDDQLRHQAQRLRQEH